MIAHLAAAALMRTLSPGARDAVLAGSRSLRAGRAEILVEKGETLSDVFLVIAGVLRVYALNREGKEATLYLLRPGDVCLLSLNAAFTRGRYPANVTVESAEADIARIPGELLRRLFGQEPAVQELVLGSLTAVVGELLTRLDEVLLSPLRERLLGHLARLADSRGRVFMTHQALADGLGVSRESVSRELQRLRRGKAVATGRGCVTLAPDGC